MKTQENKYKKAIIEILVGLTLVNGIGMYLLGNLELALTIQIFLIYFFDYLYRRHLTKSKRKKKWNIALSILKTSALLLSTHINVILGLEVTIFTVVATRIMFYDDKDRTVQTVEELKQAYFIPVIATTFSKLKQRAIYVMSE